MRLQKPQSESLLQPGIPIHGPGQVAASCQLNLWEHDDHIHKRSGRTNEACVPWSGEGGAGRRVVDLPHRGRPLSQSIHYVDKGCPTLPILQFSFSIVVFERKKSESENEKLQNW